MRTVTPLVAAVAAALLLPAGATATTAPDPYVDAVAPDNQAELVDATNLFGAPDGRFATLVGRFTRPLVLDLGAGERGVGDLEVHYALPVGAFSEVMWVDFINQNGRKIGQGMLGMYGMDGSAHVTTVENPSTRPYRYLRIVTEAQTARFDSMRAAALAP